MVQRATVYSGAALLGVLVGLLTIYLLPSQLEVFLWPGLILFLAGAGARLYEKRPFARVFVAALIVGASISITHILLVSDYLASHAEETRMLRALAITDSDRLSLLLLAPVYWVLLGLLSGGAASAVRRLFAR